MMSWSSVVVWYCHCMVVCGEKGILFPNMSFDTICCHYLSTPYSFFVTMSNLLSEL